MTLAGQCNESPDCCMGMGCSTSGHCTIL
jgi:hypothetical protein